LISVIATLTAQIADLESALADRFEQHPDADILRSLPDSRSFSAPGCSASSVTTRTATPMLNDPPWV
jgi:hypothetical protein